tara:strand:- start:576 stop:1088 length:513 start_codon:yes stop_codon:yes gene_type:complete
MVKGKVILGMLFIGLVMVFFTSGVFALTSSIDKPKMVIYKELVDGETLTFEESVIVNNVNDVEVKIIVEASGYWEGKVVVDEPEVILPAGETKEIFYTVSVSEFGNLGGDIIVTFKNEVEKSELALAQRLVVDVTEIEKESGYLIYFIGIFSIVVLSGVLITMSTIRRGK